MVGKADSRKPAGIAAKPSRRAKSFDHPAILLEVQSHRIDNITVTGKQLLGSLLQGLQ